MSKEKGRKQIKITLDFVVVYNSFSIQDISRMVYVKRRRQREKRKKKNYILWAIILFPSEISAEWFMSGSRQQRLLFPRDYTGKPEDKTFFHTGCTQINT